MVTDVRLVYAGKKKKKQVDSLELAGVSAVGHAALDMLSPGPWVPLPAGSSL